MVVKIVKMKTLFNEELEIVEKVKEKDEENHVHDNTRCIHAKGLKCRCKCHAVFHGWAWKSKLEKLDKYLEENEPFFDSLEDFLRAYSHVLEKAAVPNLFEANKALEAMGYE